MTERAVSSVVTSTLSCGIQSVITFVIVVRIARQFGREYTDLNNTGDTREYQCVSKRCMNLQ